MTAARVSQLTLEPLISPSDASARVSQLTLEPLISPSDASARVSQFVVEPIYRMYAAGQVSQLALEVARARPAGRFWGVIYP